MLSPKAKDLLERLAREAGIDAAPEQIETYFLDVADPELIEEAAKAGGEESMIELRRALGLEIYRDRTRSERRK